MDQTDKEKLTSEQMLNISAVKAQALKAVNS
jgi:hypothetical protein